MAGEKATSKPFKGGFKAKRPYPSKEDPSKKPITAVVTAKPIPQNHKEQQELRVQRKIAANPNFTLIQELKALWELARQKRLTPKEREPKIARMIAMAKTHLKDIIFQHDSARVVQSMIRYGTLEQRALIHAELVEHTVELSKAKYSRHIVPKLLQYGTRPQRDAIIVQFYGHVRRLMRQKIASEILAAAYIDYSTAQQRASLIAEFYGPQFALFKHETTKSLHEILAEQPTKRPFLMKHLKQAITPMLEKGLCSHLILHRALREYLEETDGDDRANMIDTIKELAVEMLHSKDGARVAIFCLQHCGAKDRKLMLRSFKPYIPKIAQEEHGYLVLLAALDVVDDTVLLKKTVLAEMEEHLMELATNLYSRKVLLYISAHRSRQHFLPAVITQLAKLDDNPHSKKDMAVRRQQLLESASPMLLQLVHEHAAELCLEGQTALLVREILCNCSGDLVPAMVSVAQTSVSGEAPLVHDAAGHRFLRKMVDEDIRSGDRTFNAILVEQIVDAGGRSELFKLAKSNRSAFVILRLLESTSDPDAVKRLRAELSAFPTELAALDAKKKAPLELSAGTKLILSFLAGEDTSQSLAAPEPETSAKKSKPTTPASKSASAPATKGVSAKKAKAASPKTQTAKSSKKSKRSELNDAAAAVAEEAPSPAKSPKASAKRNAKAAPVDASPPAKSKPKTEVNDVTPRRGKTEEQEEMTPRRSTRKRKPVKHD